MNDLKWYRWVLGGWSERQAADTLGISLKTYRRYERGAVPLAALKLIAVLAGGDLGLIHPTWEGWHLLRGELISPENSTFTPGEIRAIPYREALIAALKSPAQPANKDKRKGAQDRRQRRYGQR